ncbi:MAG: hypothetical protein AAB891_01670 [Patescibacteria group bacterium]
MKSPNISQSRSASATLRKGQTVILQERWTHPTRRLSFHEGTVGKVMRTEIVNGRIFVKMDFPHGPSIATDLPVSLLKSA